MIRIMINDGKMTPSVAHREPRIPPCFDPINVAALTAIEVARDVFP